MNGPDNPYPADPEPVYEAELVSDNVVMVNVSGRADEPLWVQANEVAAVGVRGKDDSMLVLRGSGMQLIAKGTHPNEVVQLLCDSTTTVHRNWDDAPGQRMWQEADAIAEAGTLPGDQRQV